MDATQITELALLLRDSGDKVLNDQYKLKLSGKLLHALNEVFRLIVDEADEMLLASPGNGSSSYYGNAELFVVNKQQNCKASEMRDLQLIYDFVQKTRILCVTNFTATSAGSDSDVPVNITKFRNLRRLEISKLSVSRVRGIQKLRPNLQELKCTHSIDSVEEIISHCGGDRSNGFTWNRLQLVDFSYNRLRTVDSSLEFVEKLQYLNLSHNQIVTVDAIKWLKHLKYLNLSFNRLAFVPQLPVDATRRLNVLILSNNSIEDMNGLSRLDSLIELDISDNCLLDHQKLLPLSTLVALQILNLSGNPLACHRLHRQETSKFLHKNTSTCKFSLDNEPLSKSEKALTGQLQSMVINRPTLPYYSRRGLTSSIASSRTTLQGGSAASSIGSLPSIRMDESFTAANQGSSRIDNTDFVRRVRQKAVIIAEHPSHELPKVDEPLVVENLDAHLETKKQIEDMREQHGDRWLRSHGAKLGHESASPAQSHGEHPTPDLMQQTSTPINRSPLHTDDIFRTPMQTMSEQQLTAGDASGYETALDISESHAKPSDDAETTVPILPDLDAIDDIFRTDVNATETISEPEVDAVLYTVALQPCQTDMLVEVSDSTIRERDALTSRTVTKWSLSMLESCDRTHADLLRLNFDTRRRDNRERIYRMEVDACKTLERYLRDLLSQRPLSEMNQEMYRCLKCNVHFSWESGKLKRANPMTMKPMCPACRTEWVVPDRDKAAKAVPDAKPSPARSATYSAPPSEQQTPANALEGSESQSSIGSAQSLNESSSCSRISKSSSFDSNRSNDGSDGPSGRCRRVADFAADGQSLESDDVEVVSNPSQSSIEVLEYNASRKHSADESSTYIGLDAYHRSTIALSLDTVAEQINQLTLSTCNQQTSTRDLLDAERQHADAIASSATDAPPVSNQQRLPAPPPSHHLTESSSSGSVTDSICTAYDTNQRLGAQRSPEKATPSADVSMISSLIGGLFQSTNNLLSRSSSGPNVTGATTPAGPRSLSEPYKFSYGDFEDVDHRLKLYLYQTVFEDDNEQLKWLVRGHVLFDEPLPTNGGKWQRGAAIFVMSTTKFYVFQICAPEHDEMSKWVKRQMAGTIDRLQKVHVLPWKIGLSIGIAGYNGTMQLLLQDIHRTDSLLLFLANNPLPESCHLKYQPEEVLVQRLLATTRQTPLKMLAILAECTCTATLEDESDSSVNAKTTIVVPAEKLSGLIVTETDLYVVESAQHWLHSDLDGSAIAEEATMATSNDSTAVVMPLRTLQSNAMHNLVAADVLSERQVRLSFHDELQGHQQDEWTCTFETADNAVSTLDAVKQSWERLFGVPLLPNS